MHESYCLHSSCLPPTHLSFMCHYPHIRRYCACIVLRVLLFLHVVFACRVIACFNFIAHATVPNAINIEQCVVTGELTATVGQYIALLIALRDQYGNVCSPQQMQDVELSVAKVDLISGCIDPKVRTRNMHPPTHTPTADFCPIISHAPIFARFGCLSLARVIPPLSLTSSPSLSLIYLPPSPLRTWCWSTESVVSTSTRASYTRTRSYSRQSRQCKLHLSCTSAKRCYIRPRSSSRLTSWTPKHARCRGKYTQVHTYVRTSAHTPPESCEMQGYVPSAHIFVHTRAIKFKCRDTKAQGHEAQRVTYVRSLEHSGCRRRSFVAKLMCSSFASPTSSRTASSGRSQVCAISSRVRKSVPASFHSCVRIDLDVKACAQPSQQARQTRWAMPRR